MQFAVLLVEEAQVQLSSVEFGVYSLFWCPQQGPPTSFCFSFTFASLFVLLRSSAVPFLCSFRFCLACFCVCFHFWELKLPAACWLLLLLFVLTQKTELCLMGFCYVFWHFGNNVSASGLRCAVRAHCQPAVCDNFRWAPRNKVNMLFSWFHKTKVTRQSPNAIEKSKAAQPIFKHLIYIFFLRYKL